MSEILCSRTCFRSHFGNSVTPSYHPVTVTQRACWQCCRFCFFLNLALRWSEFSASHPSSLFFLSWQKGLLWTNRREGWVGHSPRGRTYGEWWTPLAHSGNPSAFHLSFTRLHTHYTGWAIWALSNSHIKVSKLTYEFTERSITRIRFTPYKLCLQKYIALSALDTVHIGNSTEWVL